jgi:uncharacterized protein YhfF
VTFPEQWRDLPIGEYAFPGPVRDQLVAAIAAGDKTSTTSLVADYEVEGDPLPAVGDREVVIDSQGQPVLVTQVVAFDVMRLSEVSLEHAINEGEGFTSVAEWRRGHERFWGSDEYRQSIGDPSFQVGDDTSVVCVAFTVIDRL